MSETDWNRSEDGTEPDPSDSPDEKPSLGERLGGEMGFFEHLEELRWRIIKSLIALVLAGIACGIFYKDLWQLLLRPARQSEPPIEFQNLVPFGQITLSIQVALLAGLILAVPFILWQFWAFVRPGLFKREQKYIGLITAATILCFAGGVAFAYLIMVPTALEFAQSFQAADQIQNNFTIESYFSFVLGFILAAGAIFEMPVLSWALSRLGIVTPQFMKKYRRHAIIVLLIIAAIVTPTPDPVNQVMMAGPLYVLYEVSIVVSRVARRQRKEAMEQAMMGEERSSDE